MTDPATRPGPARPAWADPTQSNHDPGDPSDTVGRLGDPGITETGPMGDYRIDELAHAAGMTVRNVRAYQERGLLPAPRRDGRVGLYSDAHLARLHLVGRLLDRGYTVNNISELVSAWEHGRDLPEILGLEQVVTSFWSDEIPDYIGADDLTAALGQPPAGPGTDTTIRGAGGTAEVLERAVELGLVEPEDDGRYRVPSPRLLHATSELIRAGIPTEAVLSLGGHLLTAVDNAAHSVIEVIADYILGGRSPGWMPSRDEVPDLARFIADIRPATATAVHAALTQALERHVDTAFGEYIARLSPHISNGGRAAGDAAT